MKDTDGVAPGIDDNDRQTIGGEHPQKNSWNIGHHSIACKQSIIFWEFSDAMNKIRMDLANRDQRRLLSG